MNNKNIEVWQDMKGYDGYQISNLGRARKIYNGKILKPVFRKDFNGMCYRMEIGKGLYSTRLISVLMDINFNGKEDRLQRKAKAKYVDFLDNDEWFDIPDYEGLYKINRNGDVINRKGRLISKHKHKKYIRINLYKDGKEKSWRLHRLVAITFIPNPNNYLEVNHKDEDPSNNTVNNLEWCTGAYNLWYSSKAEREKRLRERLSA
ncbi:NUMOD4 domain-containing protein [Sinanaerobacter chloroacetimidivorans]|uniref:HNH endonuclease n=1 Tax=Sinanaerobacter chloroacetimidivorans TaxID=2818044 RepID=A0A8J7W1F0_9FIRM|nr:NUMOD4 domain-containing protein [Sinanaerobacter chloroacetimidivorans]MBR0599054.1 HNH endonuclease [Sinanaerobacter chloroacetimidivorans]